MHLSAFLLPPGIGARTLAAVVLTAGIGACAAPGADPASRHQHMRDAKQGAAMPYPAQDQPAAPKPLHDHREMK